MVNIRDKVGRNEDGSPMTVGALMRTLGSRFPGGFTTKEASPLMWWRINGDNSKLYRRLANAGFLSAEVINGKSGKGAKYRYSVVRPQDDGSSDSPPTELLLTYAASRGTEDLERVIVADEAFLRTMEETRKTDPDLHRKLGGNYLDYLLDSQ